MNSQTATASRIIAASADIIYNIIADFRHQHAKILPKQYFQDLEVEEGGFGEGTVNRFQMRLLGQTQHFRTRITEPEPQRVLVETDIQSGTPTTFRIHPLEDGSRTRVTLSTELKNRGIIEGFLGKLMLERVYRAELDLLAKLAEEQKTSNRT